MTAVWIVSHSLHAMETNKNLTHDSATPMGFSCRMNGCVERRAVTREALSVECRCTTLVACIPSYLQLCACENNRSAFSFLLTSCNIVFQSGKRNTYIKTVQHSVAKIGQVAKMNPSIPFSKHANVQTTTTVPLITSHQWRTKHFACKSSYVDRYNCPLMNACT